MTRRVATRLNSNILLANAWHHRIAEVALL